MKRIKILNNSSLKVIAAILMLIDHIGFILLPNIALLHYIGRLAYPIFAFCIAEGYFHTRNKYIYFIKLFGFAFITEPIFDLAFYNTLYYTYHQNVLFTFSLSVFYLMICDYINEKNKYKDTIYDLPQLLLWLVFNAIAILIKCDYDAYGFTLVILFYIIKKNKNFKPFIIPAFQLLALRGSELYSIFSNVIIYLYNGKKGYNLRYFFYFFYPGHLLVLYIIKLLI